MKTKNSFKKPATKKARFVAFEPDGLDEIVKSSQAHAKGKNTIKWRLEFIIEMYGRITRLLLEN